jgi:hypothetical protein
VSQRAASRDPGDNGGDDPEDPDNYDDDLKGGGNPSNTPGGWTLTYCFHDSGVCFFHWRLHDLLHHQFGFGMFSIQYESTHWSHPRYEAYWKTCVHIGRPNPYLRALRIMSTREAQAPHSTQETSINDTAR